MTVFVLALVFACVAPQETAFEEWLCEVLRGPTPETLLRDFPDEGASSAALRRGRVGPEVEDWEIVSDHYRVRLRYRQPEGTALRTGLELSVEAIDENEPFVFSSLEEAERWLARLEGDGEKSRDDGVIQYSETREGSVRPHFRVAVDVKERTLEIFWQEKWLVDHPSPLYRRFGPDYRERMCRR